MDIKEALNLDGLKYFYTQYIKPLKTGAFATVVNNATTTVANTVLDGRMGKTLADKDANLQNQINTLNSSLNDIEIYCTHLTANKPVLDDSENTYYLPTELPIDKILPIGYKASSRYGWKYEFYTSEHDIYWRVRVYDNSNASVPSGNFNGYMVWVKHNNLSILS